MILALKQGVRGAVVFKNGWDIPSRNKVDSVINDMKKYFFILKWYFLLQKKCCGMENNINCVDNYVKDEKKT